MTRVSKHIALVALFFFTVSAIGIPVAANYCTMQKTVRTGGACCACPSASTSAGERITARPCIEHTELGAPIAATYTISGQYVHADLSVLDVIPARAMLQPCSVCMQSPADAHTGAPPPLLQNSLLLI